MKASILSLFMIFLVTTAFSQWKGDNYIQLSRTITSETKDITGFDKIDVSEDFKVFIRFSEEAESVVVKANENLHDVIRVEQQGTALKIYTDSYSSGGWGKKNRVKEILTVHITAKSLSEIKGNEDVRFIVEDNLYADHLTIDLDEDSSLDGFIEVNDLVVNLDEDSILKLDGSAQRMKVRADEDSIIKGYGFTVSSHLDIKLNEDSEVNLTVNGNIDLRAKEDSIFCFKGEGKFTRKFLTGDSEVRYY